MSVYKRGSHWHYRFRVRRVRYRGALPEASTKWEAEQAESKIKQEIFEGRFGLVDLGSERLADFISKTFLPWSKANKRSWRHDVFRARTICDYFGTKTFREMSPLLIEKFQRDRRESITRREKVRSPASVNHELTLLSKIFNLAIDYKVTDTNPCTKVKKYKLDNKRYRYLTGRRTATNGGTQWATRSFEAAGNRGYRYRYAAERAVAAYLGSRGLLTTGADSDQDKD